MRQTAVDVFPVRVLYATSGIHGSEGFRAFAFRPAVGVVDVAALMLQHVVTLAIDLVRIHSLSYIKEFI